MFCGPFPPLGGCFGASIHTSPGRRGDRQTSHRVNLPLGGSPLPPHHRVGVVSAGSPSVESTATPGGHGRWLIGMGRSLEPHGRPARMAVGSNRFLVAHGQVVHGIGVPRLGSGFPQLIGRLVVPGLPPNRCSRAMPTGALDSWSPLSTAWVNHHAASWASCRSWDLSSCVAKLRMARTSPCSAWASRSSWLVGGIATSAILSPAAGWSSIWTSGAEARVVRRARLAESMMGMKGGFLFGDALGVDRITTRIQSGHALFRLFKVLAGALDASPRTHPPTASVCGT